jgi:hypothetical protein
MSVVPIEKPVAGGKAWYLFLKQVHQSVQRYPDERDADHGPLWDVDGVFYTLRIKEGQSQPFCLK